MNAVVFLFVAYIVFRVWRATQRATTRPRTDDLSSRIERLREWDGEAPLDAPPAHRQPASVPVRAIPDDGAWPEAEAWPSEIVRGAETPAAVPRPSPVAVALAVDARRAGAPLTFSAPPSAAPAAYESGRDRGGAPGAASPPQGAVAPAPPVVLSRAAAAAASPAAPAPPLRPAWASAAPAVEMRAETVPVPVTTSSSVSARGLAKAPVETAAPTADAPSPGKVGSGAARAAMQRSMLGKAPATSAPETPARTGAARAKG